MMVSGEENNPLWCWEMYFEELSDFIASLDGDRITFAKERFDDCVVDRLSTCVSMLSRLFYHLQSSSNSIELDEDYVEIVEYYHLLLNQLLGAIRHIASEWQRHLTIYKLCLELEGNLPFKCQAIKLLMDQDDLNLM